MAFVIQEVNTSSEGQVARHSITLDRVTLPPYVRMLLGHVHHKQYGITVASGLSVEVAVIHTCSLMYCFDKRR
jgi:hypothetical protein